MIKKPSIRQKQAETIDQYAARLLKDVAERPDFYYTRREVAVLDSDVMEFRAMRDCVARQIQNAREEQNRYEKPEFAWPRNCGRFTCQGCEFSLPCLQGISISHENIPSGFRLKNMKVS